MRGFNLNDLDQQDRATILAALRAFQNIQQHEALAPEIIDIATDGGAFQMLDDGDIDDLCERLNVEPEAQPVELSECCHAEIGYDAWVDSNGVLNGGPFDNCICTNCSMEEPKVWDGKSPPWPREEREGGVDLPEGVEEPDAA